MGSLDPTLLEPIEDLHDQEGRWLELFTKMVNDSSAAIRVAFQDVQKRDAFRTNDGGFSKGLGIVCGLYNLYEEVKVKIGKLPSTEAINVILAQVLLGIQISRNSEEKTITLSQPAMIEALARKFEQTEGKSFETPMAPDFDGTPIESEPTIDQKDKPYRSLIGALMFIAGHTRVDIAMPVNELARRMSAPQEHHWKAALRVLRYAYETKELGLTYRGDLPDHTLNKVFGHSDASWGCCRATRKSRAGWMITLNGASIAWASKMIPSPSMSSAESETAAAVMLVKEILSARLLLWELGYGQPGSTTLYNDNQATIKSASGEGQSKQAKYYQMKTSFLRHHVRLGKVNFQFTPTADQFADGLTKPQPADLFKRHRAAQLGRAPATFDEIIPNEACKKIIDCRSDHHQ